MVEIHGFEVGVFIAGHYPLIDQARAAALFITNEGAKQGKISHRLPLIFCTCRKNMNVREITQADGRQVTL
ncbi:MAG: hypothetical protein FWC19_08400 [Treponema sp.]|nr:hypothetical protein [Treponema sp.]